MQESDTKLHYLVLRQLKRSNANVEDISPNAREQWNDFVLRVSRTYSEFEQDRYLLERSMDISSSELMELNNKLEYAQQIAHLGYWLYDRVEGKLTWSKEMFHLAGIDPSEGEPSFEQLMQELVHENDRPVLADLIQRAFNEGKDFEIELRLKNKKEAEYYWLYAKGHHQENDSSDSQYNRFLSGIAIDITKRKQAEQRESLRHRLTSVLAEKSSLNAAAPEVLKIICEAIGLELGELWTVDKINNVLRCITTWSADNTNIHKFVEVSKQSTFPTGIGLPGRAWSDKKLCWIEDVIKDDNFPRVEWAKKANLHSAFALPIIFENEVLAVIDFFSHRIFSLSDEMLDLLNDIDRQIGIFIAREQTQSQVATLSRQAGMSEVATSVLHNVGNILNSATVSIALVRDLISKSHLDKLIKLSHLIDKHLKDKDDYLTNDQNGILVPDYLIALSKSIYDEYNNISKEIDNINVHLEHINDIVAMQKDISGIAGVKENIFLSEVADLAVQMSCRSIEADDITIIKKYDYNKSIVTDKAKLLQILVNLIRNARDAVMSFQNRGQREIIIWIKKSEDKPVLEIIVKDNGAGITDEYLTRIFSFGFTTKPNGHGFGLHSSAITANELGGSLRARSKGIGNGATFTVELPLSMQNFEENKLTKIDERLNL